METDSISNGRVSSSRTSTSSGEVDVKLRRSRDTSDDGVGEDISPAAKRANFDTSTLSSDDYSLIDAYFRHCNVMLPCVDEGDFRTMLGELESQQKKISTAFMNDHKNAAETNSKVLLAAVSDGKFAAFRVLVHTILSCAALIEGRSAIARHHYGVSCALIPLCSDMKSRHLVSALLVLSLIERSFGNGDVNQSLEHMRLAWRISDQATGVSTEVRTTALVLYEINSPGPLMCALTLHARYQEEEEDGTGLSLATGIEARLPHERLALFVGNVIRWGYAYINLPHVQPLVSVPKTAVIDLVTMMQPLLEKSNGIFKGVPLQIIVPAGTAYIHFFKGNVAQALQFLANSLRLAAQDPLALFFQPVVFMLRDLIAKARTAIIEMRSSSSLSSFVSSSASVDVDVLEADMQQFMQHSTFISGKTSSGRGELFSLSAIFWPQKLSYVDGKGPELEASIRSMRRLELMGELPEGTVNAFAEHKGYDPEIGSGTNPLPLLYAPLEAIDTKISPSTSDVISTYLDSNVGRFMAWDDPASEVEGSGADFDLNDFDADAAIDVVDVNARSRGLILGHSSDVFSSSSPSISAISLSYGNNHNSSSVAVTQA